MAAVDSFFAGSRYYRTVGDWACTAGNIGAPYAQVQDPYPLANAVGTVPANAIVVEMRGVLVLVASGNGADRAIGITGKNVTLVVGGQLDEAICDIKEPAGLVAGTVFAKIPFNLLCRLTVSSPPSVSFDVSYTGDAASPPLSYVEGIAVNGYWLQ